MNDDPSSHGPNAPGPAEMPQPAAEAPAPAIPDPVVLTIGDIGITRYWVVTPNGSAPLAGSTWIPRDMTTTDSKIPTWAIVLAVIFALFCLVGLFFLLVKEQVTRGYFEVTVTSESLMHTTQIPISREFQVAQMRQLVSQAQSMAAAAARA